MNYDLNAVDVSLIVQIVNDDGAPVTGLVAATFPDVYLVRNDGTTQLSPLIDLAAQDSDHSDGGTKELTGGRYRLDVSDDPFTTGGPLDVIGEASGKRLLHPQIEVGDPAKQVRIEMDNNSTQLAKLSSNRFVFVNPPTLQHGRLTPLVQGDAYLNSDGRAIEFTHADWPNLTGAGNPTLTLSRTIDGTVTTHVITGTVVTPTGTKLVRFEPDATETGSWNVGEYSFEVQITLASGARATLIDSSHQVQVLADLS